MRERSLSHIYRKIYCASDYQPPPYCDVITCETIANFMQRFILITFRVFSTFQVRDLVEKCTCPSQFPMIRVSEGKYRIGDTKVLIFVRVSTLLGFINFAVIYGNAVVGKSRLFVASRPKIIALEGN